MSPPGGREITEEQRERMRRNKAKALEIQARKRKEREEAAAAAQQHEQDIKRQKTPEKVQENKKEEDEDVELEEFEVGAPPLVTKKEAMKMYLLPEGTLAVCKFEEKQNPRHKGWNAMKLYHRSEIRRRARERFGGLQGLVEERRRREEKRFERDLEKSKKLFE